AGKCRLHAPATGTGHKKRPPAGAGGLLVSAAPAPWARGMGWRLPRTGIAGPREACRSVQVDHDCPVAFLADAVRRRYQRLGLAHRLAADAGRIDAAADQFLDHAVGATL